MAEKLMDETDNVKPLHLYNANFLTDIKAPN